MTQRRQSKAKKPVWKELLGQEEDFLKELVREVVQQVLEAEMEEALGAGKGERTGTRLGYRSGYYSRTLVTRVGKLELREPQIGKDDSVPRSSSATSEVKRRWCAHWPRCTFKASRLERSRRLRKNCVGTPFQHRLSARSTKSWMGN